MTDPESPPPAPVQRPSRAASIGALVLIVEALGIAVLALWQVLAIFRGDTVSLASALALIVLTFLFAVAVASFAVATMRSRSWGRSGGVVTQVLVLAIALGALTGQYAHPFLALVLAVPAVIGIWALWAAARAAGRNAPR
ncbi:histidine kinase [uncultured Microbacterium sp.]|jgi:multisubunit Na+/H+ antiporter MnhF subunit|uniref:histidine kinase n=1 Tax=uncultured Microbacterium sp. TaxID=191216 RepID=UPI0025E02E00|nr:histidine kinase [uncultured Microbacterium sp.]